MASSNPTTYNAKLPPGIHPHDLSSFYDLTVAPYPEHTRRHNLWHGFLGLYHRLLKANLHGLEIWIDGSFLTDKFDPQDIDCVLWIPESHINECGPDEYTALCELRDIAASQRNDLTHLFLAPAGDQDNIQYWTRWFRDGRDPSKPQGFVRIAL